MTTVVPVLGSDGWCSDPARMGEILFSHFLLSDYSQSNLFAGQIVSLAYIIQDKAGKPLETAIAVREALTKYYSKYFSDVVVEVEPEINDSDPLKTGIKIFIQYTGSDNNKYSVGRLATYSDGKINKVVNIFNG